MKIPAIKSHSDLIQFSEAWIRFDYNNKCVIDISRFALNSDYPNWAVKKCLLVKDGKSYFKDEKVLVKRFLLFDSNIDLSDLKKTKLKFVSASESLITIDDMNKMKPIAFRLAYSIFFWR